MVADFWFHIAAKHFYCFFLVQLLLHTDFYSADSLRIYRVDNIVVDAEKAIYKVVDRFILSLDASVSLDF